MLKIEDLKPDDYVIFGYFDTSYSEYCTATVKTFIESAMDYNGTLPDRYKLDSTSSNVTKSISSNLCLFASYAVEHYLDKYKVFYIPKKYVMDSIAPASKEEILQALGSMLTLDDYALSKFINNADDLVKFQSQIDELLETINHERQYYPRISLSNISYKTLRSSEVDCTNLEQAFKAMYE